MPLRCLIDYEISCENTCYTVVVQFNVREGDQTQVNLFQRKFFRTCITPNFKEWQ